MSGLRILVTGSRALPLKLLNTGGWCPTCRTIYPQANGEIDARGRKVDRTHCPQGHEYTPENTYVYKRGNSFMRHCRQCSFDRAAKRRLSRMRRAS